MSKNLFVFDLDGVILDSRKSNTIACKEAFKKNNLPEPKEERVMEMIGKPSEEMVEILLQEFGKNPNKEIVNKIAFEADQIHTNIVGKFAKLFDGVKEVLESINNKGDIILACTNGAREEQTKALSELGVFNLFSELQTKSDSTFRKPDPRFLGELIDRVSKKHSFDNIIYIDDSKLGIEMAKNFSDNIKTVYAAYGYGMPADGLADYTATDVKNLTSILENFK